MLNKLQVHPHHNLVRIWSKLGMNFTLTTNKGYVDTVAPSLAKAPSRKTCSKNNTIRNMNSSKTRLIKILVLWSQLYSRPEGHGKLLSQSFYPSSQCRSHIAFTRNESPIKKRCCISYESYTSNADTFFNPCLLAARLDLRCFNEPSYIMNWIEGLHTYQRKSLQ